MHTLICMCMQNGLWKTHLADNLLDSSYKKILMTLVNALKMWLGIMSRVARSLESRRLNWASVIYKQCWTQMVSLETHWLSWSYSRKPPCGFSPCTGRAPLALSSQSEIAAVWRILAVLPVRKKFLRFSEHWAAPSRALRTCFSNSDPGSHCSP